MRGAVMGVLPLPRGGGAGAVRAQARPCGASGSPPSVAAGCGRRGCEPGKRSGLGDGLGPGRSAGIRGMPVPAASAVRGHTVTIRNRGTVAHPLNHRFWENP
ncbi:hypothetical protein GCM10027570_46590 [Streptomonospora sediminis]